MLKKFFEAIGVTPKWGNAPIEEASNKTTEETTPPKKQLRAEKIKPLKEEKK